MKAESGHLLPATTEIIATAVVTAWAGAYHPGCAHRMVIRTSSLGGLMEDAIC